MLAGLIDAMQGWRSRYASKFDQIWAFAGIQGGGGILNVDTIEEMDAVMREFPFLPVSDVEIIPLVDIDNALAGAKGQIQQMMAGG